jgi:hypothetical protein
MSGHTPGPWVAIFPEERYFYCGSDITSFEVLTEKTRSEFREEGITHYGRLHEEVANVEIVTMQFWGDKTDDEAKANARLIAAAPDLLAALQDLCADELNTQDKWDNAREAIAKATGGAQ